MLATGVLPEYFEGAIQETVHAGREETLKILLDSLDASSPQFCSQGRRSLSHALGRAEIEIKEDFARLARKLREQGRYAALLGWWRSAADLACFAEMSSSGTETTSSVNGLVMDFFHHRPHRRAPPWIKWLPNTSFSL
jgi:hypothetical protein